MNKLSGFVLLFAVIVLVSVSYLTYAKNASAIYFRNGACPSGEARDFMGVCYPIKECRGGPFQGAGTCSVSTVTKGEGGKVTVTAPSGRHILSPLANENEHSLKNMVVNPLIEGFKQGMGPQDSCKTAAHITSINSQCVLKKH
jgi:hypothetical protein